MNTLIITPKNDADFKLVSDLLARLDIDTTVFSEEELEDFGLIELMKEADLSEKVSRAGIISKLSN